MGNVTGTAQKDVLPNSSSISTSAELTLFSNIEKNSLVLNRQDVEVLKQKHETNRKKNQKIPNRSRRTLKNI